MKQTHSGGLEHSSLRRPSFNAAGKNAPLDFISNTPNNKKEIPKTHLKISVFLGLSVVLRSLSSIFET